MTSPEPPKPEGLTKYVRKFVNRLRGKDPILPVEPSYQDLPIAAADEIAKETDEESSDQVIVANMVNGIIRTMDRFNEADRFNQTIELSRSRIRIAVSTHPDDSTKARWSEKTTNFVKAVTAAKKLTFTPLKPYSAESGDSVKTISRQRLAWAVRSFETWEIYQDMQSLSDSSGLRDLIQDDIRLLECTEVLGPMVVKLGPMSLSQFITEKTDSAKAGEYLKFYGEAVKAHLQIPTTQPLVGNETFPWNQFPIMSRDRILRSADLVAAGVLGAPDQINYSKKYHQQIEPEMLDLIKQVFQSFTHKSLAIKEALLNPTSVSHATSISTLATYADQMDGQQWFMLMAAKVSSNDNLKNFYRLVNNPNADPALADSYQKVNNMLENMATQVKNSKRVVLADLPYITDFQNKSVDKPVTLGTLHQDVTSFILRKNHGKDFALDPWIIEGTGIVPPAKLEIHFDPSSNCKFEVVYDYSSDDDQEPLVFKANINTKKGTLDWNLLNSPDQDNSTVQNLKQAVLVATQLVLGEIKKLTNITQVKNLPDQPPKQSKTGEIRNRFDDPVYKLKKEARKVQTENKEEDDTMNHFSVDTGNVTHAQVIALSSPEGLAELLEDVLPQHRNGVLDGINDFNEFGKGDFRNIANPELNKRGYDYRLRVKNGLRIMLQTVENMPGQQVFAIADILYRANAYQ